MPTVRRVTDPHDPAIAAFGALQEQVYFEPDMLIPAPYIGQLLGQPGADRHNALLVVEDGADVLGGSLFHYLAAAGAGFGSFMGVAASARGRGLARQLHEARWQVLDDLSDGACTALFIDVVSPERLSADQRQAEAAVGSDPHARRRAFGALGFGTVDLRYEQPLGGEHGGPVTDLDLLCCPRRPAPEVPTALVVATMLAYWTPWMGARRAQTAAAQLEDRAAGRASLALLPAWASPALG